MGGHTWPLFLQPCPRGPLQLPLTPPPHSPCPRGPLQLPSTLHPVVPARGGPSSSPSPLHPVFQVIIIQSQVQPQPENTTESRAPTEELSRGAQASSKRKEERPPSQENPEVGGGGLGAAVGRAPQGLGQELAL